MVKAYEVGDVVAYEPFGGGRRVVEVTESHADVKNGRPGFFGFVHGRPAETVWGYDAQILEVMASPPAPVVVEPEPEPENVPCVNCGRGDLPLHSNRRCGACGPFA